MKFRISSINAYSLKNICYQYIGYAAHHSDKIENIPMIAKEILKTKGKFKDWN